MTLSRDQIDYLTREFNRLLTEAYATFGCGELDERVEDMVISGMANVLDQDGFDGCKLVIEFEGGECSLEVRTPNGLRIKIQKNIQ